MITKKQLKDNQWRRFSWDNGTIIEYWKPIDSRNDFELCPRLSVRFGEYRNVSFVVYLFTSSNITPLLHIQQYSQLQELYSRLYNPHYQSMQDFVLSHNTIK